MEAWIRALNETRRALAERDELVERADERSREAAKGQAVSAGQALPIPERAATQDQMWAGTAGLSESMSGMSLSTSARSSHAHATGHVLPSSSSGEVHDTPRKASVPSPHVADPGRSLAPPIATRGSLTTSLTTASGNEFEEYGMTPVVPGVGVGAAIITSSESEDDVRGGRAYEVGRNGSGSVGRAIDFDERKASAPLQTLSPVSNATSPTVTSPVNYGTSLASSLPINGNPVSSPIQTDPHKVILSGYLTKLGNKRKTWRKRWFVLTSGELVYTKSHMVGLRWNVRPVGGLIYGFPGYENSSSDPPELYARCPRIRCASFARFRWRFLLGRWKYQRWERTVNNGESHPGCFEIAYQLAFKSFPPPVRRCSPGSLYCSVCQCIVALLGAMAAHVSGRHAQTNVQALRADRGRRDQVARGAEGFDQSGKGDDVARCTKWERVCAAPAVSATSGGYHAGQPTNEYDCYSSCFGANRDQFTCFDAARSEPRGVFGSIDERTSDRACDIRIDHGACVVLSAAGDRIDIAAGECLEASRNTELAPADHKSVTPNPVGDTERESSSRRRRSSVPSRDVTSSTFTNADVDCAAG